MQKKTGTDVNANDTSLDSGAGDNDGVRGGGENINDESHDDSGADSSSTVTFSHEQEQLFSRRFEEGYDFFDEEYMLSGSI